MDAGGGGGGTAPAPAPHGRVSGRASSALAAVSVVLILLYLFWRFVWQCRKHENGSSSTGATATSSSSPAPLPSCPPRAAAAFHGEREAAWRGREKTTLPPVFVRVEAAAGRGAEKEADCAVCLAELGDGEAPVRLVPGCGHGFHAECIEAWFRVNSTCPLCRAAVAAAGEAPQYCSSV